MYKVKLYQGGEMGIAAKNVLEQLDNVELVPFEKVGVYDILFSASYAGKIGAEQRASAALGAVNIHTGLLPEGRGSHPLNWALIWGKQKTGITIHKITDTYDAGDICMQHEVPIFETDTIIELRQRVNDFFPQAISTFFQDPERFMREAVQQNQAHASYAQKRTPEDGHLNANATPREMYNFIRAHDPNDYPAFMYRPDGTKVELAGAKFEIVNGKETITMYEI